MYLTTKLALFCALILYLLVLKSSAIDLLKEVTSSVKEKDALDKFKAIVIPKIPPSSYTQNYKNDDLYFFRWLRAQNFNVDKAVEMFTNDLEWREKEKIDNIDKEDWTKFEKTYPFFDDTSDKQGRPAAEFWFSYWNIREAVSNGDQEQLLRWVIRKMEVFQRRIYLARAQGKEEVTQGVLMVAIKGFNVTRQGCPACIPIYVNIVSLYQNHYPETGKDLYFLDMHWTFDFVLRAMQPFMTTSTRESLKVYSNRDEWVKRLDNEFEKSERSTIFGGTIVRDVKNDLDLQYSYNNKDEEEESILSQLGAAGAHL